MALFNLLVQWDGLTIDDNGFVPLAIAKFNLIKDTGDEAILNEKIVMSVSGPECQRAFAARL